MYAIANAGAASLLTAAERRFHTESLIGTDRLLVSPCGPGLAFESNRRTSRRFFMKLQYLFQI